MLVNTLEPDKLAYSIEELSGATSLSKAFLRNEIRSGNLKSKKIGRRVLILKKFVDEWLNTFAGVATTSEVGNSTKKL